jgi:hypothetical protein
MLSKRDSIEWMKKRMEEYRSLKNDIREVVNDFDEVGKLGRRFTSIDELEEINIGGEGVPRPTYVSAHLTTEQKGRMQGLFERFVDCFAWEYNEMLGLDRSLVEHWLPMKQGFRPHKQSTSSFSLKVIDRVKEEIDRLLKAGFIQPCRYAEWVSNIVPVEKKNTGKIRVCIDFRNLNQDIPKDEYPMLVADVLINNAFSNKITNFLDGNAGYNQIFMAEKDVHRTAFQCPGFIGLFEVVVMMFGLKNAGATYQRAVNLIFHDLLGAIMEIHIDDVVIKSAGFDAHMADMQIALERMRKYGLRMNPLKCTFGVSADRFLGFVVHEKGIQVDLKKIESIRKFGRPTYKRGVQKLLGKINYL